MGPDKEVAIFTILTKISTRYKATNNKTKLKQSLYSPEIFLSLISSEPGQLNENVSGKIKTVKSLGIEGKLIFEGMTKEVI